MGGVVSTLTFCAWGMYLSTASHMDLDICANCHKQGIALKKRTDGILDHHNRLCEIDKLSEAVSVCIWVTSQLRIGWRRDHLYLNVTL